MNPRNQKQVEKKYEYKPRWRDIAFLAIGFLWGSCIAIFGVPELDEVASRVLGTLIALFSGWKTVSEFRRRKCPQQVVLGSASLVVPAGKDSIETLEIPYETVDGLNMNSASESSPQHLEVSYSGMIQKIESCMFPSLAAFDEFNRFLATNVGLSQPIPNASLGNMPLPDTQMNFVAVLIIGLGVLVTPMAIAALVGAFFTERATLCFFLAGVLFASAIGLIAIGRSGLRRQKERRELQANLLAKRPVEDTNATSP